MSKDEHVIEALGKSRITIEDGKITDIQEPIISYCPIFAKYRNIQQLTTDNIRKNIEYRIDTFGMCTDKRKIKEKDMLSVGISEILKSNTKLGYIDCVVGVCEGVGTLLMTEPEVIQGVGGRVSGLIKTSPIPEVIKRVGIENVIDPENATLDPIAGLDTAIKKGYKNIAVTLLPSELVRKVREYPKPKDVNVYILIAHTTNISMEDTQEIFEYADIITACASKNIRNYANEVKPYYYGKVVPIFAITDEGRKMLDNRLKDIDRPLSTNEYPISTENIPYPLR